PGRRIGRGQGVALGVQTQPVAMAELQLALFLLLAEVSIGSLSVAFDQLGFQMPAKGQLMDQATNRLADGSHHFHRYTTKKHEKNHPADKIKPGITKPDGHPQKNEEPYCSEDRKQEEEPTDSVLVAYQRPQAIQPILVGLGVNADPI